MHGWKKHYILVPYSDHNNFARLLKSGPNGTSFSVCLVLLVSPQPHPWVLGFLLLQYTRTGTVTITIQPIQFTFENMLNSGSITPSTQEGQDPAARNFIATTNALLLISPRYVLQHFNTPVWSLCPTLALIWPPSLPLLALMGLSPYGKLLLHRFSKYPYFLSTPHWPYSTFLAGVWRATWWDTKRSTTSMQWWSTWLRYVPIPISVLGLWVKGHYTGPNPETQHCLNDMAGELATTYQRKQSRLFKKKTNEYL